MPGPDNDTKKRIIDCALKLYSEKGYANVTISDICKVSGINKNTFYYYFDSKDFLIKDYCEISDEYTMDELSIVMAQDNYIDQLWMMFEIKLKQFEQMDRDIMKQLVIINLNRKMDNFVLTEKHKNVFKMYLSLVKKCQSSGQIRNESDAEILSLALFHTFHSTILGWCLADSGYKIMPHMHLLFDTVLDVAPEYRKSEPIPIIEKLGLAEVTL